MIRIAFLYCADQRVATCSLRFAQLVALSAALLCSSKWQAASQESECLSWYDVCLSW
jgi:hypothetical protein